eukprot:CAMPEP_0181119006 /NCGR_PEP_ID=MMETSP1071-20121207/23376_1 /TAXON_ID=35127 /ORGANISM="Thalassiosira sp., Strain NH16" /LENGTH=506 /DNA_ID=CAMNT_0023203533 /DNA_START=15 /DNA_END=1531 /DNA_ORIENTATION=+
MRILLLAALSLARLGNGRASDGAVEETTTTTTTNLLRGHDDSDEIALFVLSAEEEKVKGKSSKREQKRTKNSKAAKARQSKRSKNSKGGKSESDDDDGGDNASYPTPTPRPDSPTGGRLPVSPRPTFVKPANPSEDTDPADRFGDGFMGFTDGGLHSILPGSEHSKNVVLMRGSTLVIGDGVTIRSRGGVGSVDGEGRLRWAPAVEVSESSLRVQGEDITIRGSSFDMNDALRTEILPPDPKTFVEPYNADGAGGTAISFLNGSKGLIGCSAFRPTVTDSRECAVGPAAPPELVSACDPGEYCQLSGGDCNTKIGVHLGRCAAMSERCPMNYQPVCGCDGRTYGNACVAGSFGKSISRDGPCEPVDPPVEPRVCEMYYEGGSEDCDDGEYCMLDSGSQFCREEGGLPTSMGMCIKAAEIPEEVCGCDGRTYESSDEDDYSVTAPYHNPVWSAKGLPADGLKSQIIGFLEVGIHHVGPCKNTSAGPTSRSCMMDRECDKDEFCEVSS